MGHYTLYTEPEVDKKVGEDLQLIVDRLLKSHRDQLVAILITGGFGRGEGSVVLDPKSGPRPLNDYDMVLIAKNPLRELRSALHPLSKELEQELSVQIDLGVFGEHEWHHRDPSILLYEICTGHEVLWQNEAVAWSCPQIKVEQIPLEEGTDLLFNRGMSLLRSTCSRKDGWPTNSQGQCAIHMQKATQSCGDATLLMHQKYHYSYRQRMKAFQELGSHELPPIENIQELYAEAANRKLKPQIQDPDPKLAVGLDNCIRQHEQVFKWYEEKRLGIEIRSWLDYLKPSVRKCLDAPAVNTSLIKERYIKNPIRHLRQYGTSSLSPSVLFQRIRERQISAFPAVLFGNEQEGNQALRSLGIKAEGQEGRKSFLDLWH